MFAMQQRKHRWTSFTFDVPAAHRYREVVENCGGKCTFIKDCCDLKRKIDFLTSDDIVFNLISNKYKNKD